MMIARVRTPTPHPLWIHTLRRTNELVREESGRVPATYLLSIVKELECGDLWEGSPPNTVMLAVAVDRCNGRQGA